MGFYTALLGEKVREMSSVELRGVPKYDRGP